jgi:hypothetical protein
MRTYTQNTFLVMRNGVFCGVLEAQYKKTNRNRHTTQLFHLM